MGGGEIKVGRGREGRSLEEVRERGWLGLVRRQVVDRGQGLEVGVAAGGRGLRR